MSERDIMQKTIKSTDKNLEKSNNIPKTWKYQTREKRKKGRESEGSTELSSFPKERKTIL